MKVKSLLKDLPIWIKTSLFCRSWVWTHNLLDQSFIVNFVHHLVTDSVKGLRDVRSLCLWDKTDRHEPPISLWVFRINTGKRTEWNPIRSVIIWVIKKHDRKAGVRFVNHKYDYRLTSDDTKSTYQLIINITIFKKHKKL